jgi:hypothetical protein
VRGKTETQTQPDLSKVTIANVWDALLLALPGFPEATLEPTASDLRTFELLLQCTTCASNALHLRINVSLRHRPQDAYLSLSQRLSSVGSFL